VTAASYSERVAERARLFEQTCRENNLFVSGDGRVSEADAAALLGISRGYLKALRHARNGPGAFQVSLNGARRSYTLVDLAAWVADRCRRRAEAGRGRLLDGAGGVLGRVPRNDPAESVIE
jgi:hypothetical protein